MRDAFYEMRGHIVTLGVEQSAVGVGLEIIPLKRVAHRASVNEIVKRVITAASDRLEMVYGKPCANIGFVDAAVSTLKSKCHPHGIAGFLSHYRTLVVAAFVVPKSC